MPPFVLLTSLAVLGVATSLVRAQYPSSWPQNYTGIPAGDYSPAWQKCMFMHVDLVRQCLNSDAYRL
jgi:hypothetical protein